MNNVYNTPSKVTIFKQKIFLWHWWVLILLSEMKLIRGFDYYNFDLS